MKWCLRQVTVCGGRGDDVDGTKINGYGAGANLSDMNIC